MRHNWKDIGPKRVLADPRRQCGNCEKIQERVTHYLWMRVVGYQWLPLAGRCKGDA